MVSHRFYGSSHRSGKGEGTLRCPALAAPAAGRPAHLPAPEPLSSSAAGPPHLTPSRPSRRSAMARRAAARGAASRPAFLRAFQRLAFGARGARRSWRVPARAGNAGPRRNWRGRVDAASRAGIPVDGRNARGIQIGRTGVRPPGLARRDQLDGSESWSLTTASRSNRRSVERGELGAVVTSRPAR